jgi:hypothetical protein
VKGRRKTSAMDRVLRWQSALTAERIARAIEATAAGPGQLCEDPYCPDFQRHEQARQDAATARRIGGVRVQPACDGVPVLARTVGAGRADPA